MKIIKKGDLVFIRHFLVWYVVDHTTFDDKESKIAQRLRFEGVKDAANNS